MSETSSSDDLIGVTATKAAALAGVSLRSIAQWERIGLVIPWVHERIGSKRRVRVYRLPELVELGIIRELLRRDIPIHAIRRVVEAHRSSTIPRPLSSLRWG